jgi:hypothetical protein
MVFSFLFLLQVSQHLEISGDLPGIHAIGLWNKVYFQMNPKIV